MLGETYERNYNHNYMILQAEKEEYSGFCERIIQENEIPGLLSCQFRVLDGILFFYYEISGKRTLSQLFQKRKIGTQEIRQILIALGELQNASEHYLLDFHKYILSPEYLYADFDIKHLYAVYYPDYKGENELTEIGAFFIEHVDYQETEAVELAYSFQQKIMGENVNLALMTEELLRERKELISENEEKKTVSEESLSYNFSSKESAETNTDKREPIRGKLSYNRQEQKEKWRLKDLKCVQEIWEFLQGFAFLKKEKKKGRERKEKKEKSKPIYEIELKLEEDEEIPSYYKTPAASEETQFFSCNENKETHCLIYQGRGAALDLELDVFPYIIGKGENGIDGRLESPTISRIHSQLDYINENYFITDLNSTNGTFLNGERLSPNRKTRISVGDRIQFAGEKYLFQ